MKDKEISKREEMVAMNTGFSKAVLPSRLRRKSPVRFFFFIKQISFEHLLCARYYVGIGT